MSPICRSIANVLWVVFAISSFTEIRAQDMQWEEPWVLTWNERGLGPQKESFATEQQARAAMSLKESLIRLDEYHKNPVTYSNLKLTKVGSGSQANELMEMIQDAQSAVNRAGRMIERKDVILRGDTIREYKATLEKVYKSVSQFKSDLVAQTGKVNRQVFKQINQQISEYNRDADAYNKLIRSPELATRLHAGENSNRKSGQAKHQIFNLFTPAVSIEPVQESDLHGTLEDNRSTVPQNSRSSLAGKVGEAAFSSFEVVVNFSEDSVLFGEGPTAVRGSLIQSGNEIVMQTDKFEYRGTITGDRIIGIRTPIGTNTSGEVWKIEFGRKTTESKETDENIGNTLSIAGTWEGESVSLYNSELSSRIAMQYQLVADGSGKAVHTWTTYGVDGTSTKLKPTNFTVKWISKESKVIITHFYSGGSYDSEFIMNGNVLSSQKVSGNSKYSTKLRKIK